MPEISESDYRVFVAFQQLGTPGEVQKKISDLVSDNGKQRDEIRDLKVKVPAEGAVILTGDEAKAYPALKELGKPEEVKKQLEDGKAASEKATKLERQATVAAAADASGFKAAVLEKLPGSDSLTFEVKEETVKGEDGKETKAKVAYVTGSEQGSTPKRLTEHAEAAWSDFLPSLRAEQEKTTDSQGREFVSQTPGGKTNPGYDPVAAGKAKAEEQKAARGENDLAFK